MNTLRCKSCGCGFFGLREQTFANGTKHVKAECAECGKFYQYLPQREPSEVEDLVKKLTIQLQALTPK